MSTPALRSFYARLQAHDPAALASARLLSARVSSGQATPTEVAALRTLRGMHAHASRGSGRDVPDAVASDLLARIRAARGIPAPVPAPPLPPTTFGFAHGSGGWGHHGGWGGGGHYGGWGGGYGWPYAYAYPSYGYVEPCWPYGSAPCSPWVGWPYGFLY